MHDALIFPYINQTDGYILHIGQLKDLKPFELDSKEKRIKCSIASEIEIPKGQRPPTLIESRISYALKDGPRSVTH